MPLSQADARRHPPICGLSRRPRRLMFQDVELAAYSAQLDLILAGLTESQIAALQASYLTPLRTLESAIPAAGQNLDTDRAAVWYHNKSEYRTGSICS
jgi:hypothetical protein